MRALRWIFVILAVVAVAALLAIAVEAMRLNTFIHSEAFKREIEARAGDALGGTVGIARVDLDPWRGLKLGGFFYQIDPSHFGGPGTMQVNVARVDCAYAWRDLLHRRLKLTRVTLDRPRVIVTRQPTAPPLTPPGAAPDDATASGGVTTGHTVEEAGVPFQFALERARIRDGTVSLRDAGGVSMAEFQGINAAVDLTKYYLEDYGSKDATGTVRISSLLLLHRLQLTDFYTSFTSRPGSFSASPFVATSFGGKLAGGYQMNVIRGADVPGLAGPSSVQDLNLMAMGGAHLNASPLEATASAGTIAGGVPTPVIRSANVPGLAFPSSILDLNAKGLNVAQLTAAMVSDSSAKLSGALDFQSKWRGLEAGSLNGEGDAQLTDGKLAGVKILEQLSAILRAKELAAPVISQAQTHFLVQDQITRLTGLQITSPMFQITGGGTVGFDGTLNLDLVLILARDAMRKLPKEAAASFVQKEDGTGSIAFQVTGTTADPQTDLALRLLMQNDQIPNVISKALNRFFH
jgi:hypothetical protein